MARTTWRLPDSVFAPLRSPARPLPTRSLTTLAECLISRAFVALIGAKTTLLQIPDTPRDNRGKLIVSPTHKLVPTCVGAFSGAYGIRTVVTFLRASPAGPEVVAV